jgi:hypothetical protein
LSDRLKKLLVVGFGEQIAPTGTGKEISCPFDFVDAAHHGSFGNFEPGGNIGERQMIGE